MKIYLDMDGVVASFVKGAINLLKLDIDVTEWNEWDFHLKYTTHEKFTEMMIAHEDYWHNLPIDPAAKDLVSAVLFADLNFTWLSSPWLSDPNCIPGKNHWLDKHFPYLDNERIFDKDKARHCKKGDILIDDKPSNIQKWRQAGGRGILYPAAWNGNAIHYDSRVQFVEANFFRFYRSEQLDINELGDYYSKMIQLKDND